MQSTCSHAQVYTFVCEQTESSCNDKTTFDTKTNVSFSVDIHCTKSLSLYDLNDKKKNLLIILFEITCLLGIALKDATLVRYYIIVPSFRE